VSTYFRLLVAAEPSSVDIILLVSGVVCAIASGIPLPILGILFGQLVDDLNSATCATDQSVNAGSYQSGVNHKVLLLVVIGIAQFVLIIIHLACWTLAGTRLSHRLRDKYLEIILRQEASFFDNLPAGTISSRLNVDIQTIRSGTSEKVGICISSASFFVAAYVVAFIKEPRLAGMLISLVPAYLGMMFIGSYYIERYSGQMSSSFGIASNVASNALENMQVVHAFSANNRLEAKFSTQLEYYRKAGVKKAISTGIQTGLLYFIAYAANALAFWQGARSIAGSVERGGEVPTVGAYYTVIFLLVEGMKQYNPLFAAQTANAVN
jgi:ATP-binding cassette subfamily B (MDR/TAP) protein 1